MKPAFLLRVYTLRRSRAADSFVIAAGMRCFRTIWKKIEDMETHRRGGNESGAYGIRKTQMHVSQFGSPTRYLLPNCSCSRQPVTRFLSVRRLNGLKEPERGL